MRWHAPRSSSTRTSALTLWTSTWVSGAAITGVRCLSSNWLIWQVGIYIYLCCERMAPGCPTCIVCARSAGSAPLLFPLPPFTSTSPNHRPTTCRLPHRHRVRPQRRQRTAASPPEDGGDRAGHEPVHVLPLDAQDPKGLQRWPGREYPLDWQGGRLVYSFGVMLVWGLEWNRWCHCSTLGAAVCNAALCARHAHAGAAQHVPGHIGAPV